MRWASVCTGIGAPECAWADIFGPPAFVSEIDAFPSAVLAHRFPGVPNLGDFTKIGAEHGPVDLLVGGTPCQSFSVAGKRAGLDDPRGNLTLEYLALARRLRARWLVWENVPGVLSDDGGRTLAAVFGVLGELGYGWAYRVLDAQFFGLAQRRKRVFLVAHLGSGAAPRAVLFEPESLRGDPAPRREEGERPAPTISARTSGGGGPGTDFDLDGGLVPAVAHIPEISPALKARDYKGPSSDGDGDGDGAPLVTFNARQDPTPGAGVAQPLDQDGFSQAVAFTCKDSGQDAGPLSPTLRAMGHDASHANGGGQVAAASKPSHYTRGKDGAPAETMPPLTAEQDKGNQQAVVAVLQETGKRTGKSTDDPRAGIGIGEPDDPMYTLQAGAQHGVATATMAFDLAQITHRENRSQPKPGAPAGALAAGSQPHVAQAYSITPSNSNRDYNARPVDRAQALTGSGPGMSARGGDLVAGASVRRLTPLEWERLQGFPDGWTAVTYRRKRAADGPRYKAIGNSMAVPVLRWLGQRIAAVEAILKKA